MQSVVDACSRTKLHTFGHVEPAKLVFHEPRQTSIEFPRVRENKSGCIHHTSKFILRWCDRQARSGAVNLDPSVGVDFKLCG
jgi:hypothetical protein